MGYYTYYTLSYEGPAKDEQALRDFKPSEDEFSFPEGIVQLIKDNGDNDWKWYGWQDDMQKLAKKFPNILFVLDGDGEQSDDIWQWRGKGDETEFHAMEMPPFTNPNLKFKYEN